MNNKERGEKIRRNILQDVKEHPSDIVKHNAKKFSITPQAVYRHIKRLETDGRLISTGIGKGKKYFLGDLRKYKYLFSLTNGLEEDKVWRNHYSFIFEDLPENIVDICHYGFTEMVNNAIDHSGGTEVFIYALRDHKEIKIFVMDNGEGVFKRIKRICNLYDERQALFELAKGKLTTDPINHTGEGIFFTSRVFDIFGIDSKGLKFSHNDQYEYDCLIESTIPINKIGSIIYMIINRKSQRLIKEVFDEFTAGSDEFQFNKTVIPVRLAQYGNEKLISRSQAKRLLIRIEKFQTVIFDFEGVDAVGQAFGDEIFRVYSQKNPKIFLLPINMKNDVARMVNKAISALKKQQNA